MGNTAPSDILIRCLLVPLRTVNLLIPSATIAEITTYEEPLPAPLAPDWIMGMSMWRGLSIPLLSLDSLLGNQDIGRSKNSKIAVFNTLNGNPAVPFFAVETEGIPRIYQVTADTLEVVDREQDQQGPILSRVMIDGVEAIIPDLDALENKLIQQGMRLN